MKYNKYAPHGLLQPFIECYFHWQSDGPLDEEFIVESPPSGYCSIVFNNGDDYFLKNKKYDRLMVPRNFISGQSIYSYELHLKGTINITGIVFKAAALASFFKLPIYEYTEERIGLDVVFNSSMWIKLIVDVKEATFVNEKIEAIDQFMLDQYHIQKPSTDYIDEAVSTIIKNNGLVSVNELLENAFVSRRTFERNFFQKVGLSPKYYIRILRFGYICNTIAGRKKVNWSELIYNTDYYDQSHFIKDFEEFTGRSPEQYLKENKELANFVQKPRN